MAKKNITNKKNANSRRFPKWVKTTAIIALVLFAVGVIIAAPYLTSRSSKDAVLYLRKGTSNAAVQDSLAKCVDGQFAAKVMDLIEMTGGDLSTRHGAFIIDRGESALNVARKLRRGAADEIKITINNIRTKDDLAARLSKKLMMSKQEMLNILNDKELCSSYDKTTDNIIGIFLPDTYQFLWDVEPTKLMEHMKKYSDNFWSSRRKGKAEDLGLTPDEVVTLASIVEGETSKADEKGKVARLYMNRLKQHMKLQADPTVKFALGNFALRRLRISDTRIESPWNTYYVEGLPPGPICIPEKATIDAVLDAPEHNYIYMCAKEDFSGYHNFAVSYSEHEENAKRYQNALNERDIKR